jgi:dienelactone hydrolase
MAGGDRAGGAGQSEPERAPVEREAVRIAVGGAMLDGDLDRPPASSGIVLFAHGSGSSRHSPRNRQVATRLQAGGQATLLLDLLTPAEEQVDLRTRQLRFDVELLARRLATAAAWVGGQPNLARLPIGYFGASTGAAAALIAAADHREGIGAVVSRGGRPDLAGPRLARVACPTLLIVGGADPVVLDLNREALARIEAEARLEVIPGATHLFEEPGALEAVADLADRWFARMTGTSGTTGD